MDDRLMQEWRGKRHDVFTEEIKCNDCSLSDYRSAIIYGLMQQLVRNCWKKVKFEAPHEGDENRKAGTTVLKRNDHFSFNIQEDSLL